VKKHFVTFYSPGTMVAESTVKEISSWDIGIAVAMSKDIEERHGARPYGFFFTTKKRGFRDFESKEIARSGMYYVNCRVDTLEEIEKAHIPSESILLQNMQTNGWDKVVSTKSGWAWSHQFHEGDTLL